MFIIYIFSSQFGTMFHACTDSRRNSCFICLDLQRFWQVGGWPQFSDSAVSISRIHSSSDSLWASEHKEYDDVGSETLLCSTMFFSVCLIYLLSVELSVMKVFFATLGRSRSCALDECCNSILKRHYSCRFSRSGLATCYQDSSYMPYFAVDTTLLTNQLFVFLCKRLRLCP